MRKHFCDEIFSFSLAHLLRKIPYFACAFVTNLSRNYELRTTNSLRDQMRKGVARSLLKTGSKQRNFCQFFEIFTNFYEFLRIFCNFSDRLAHLMREFIRIRVKTYTLDRQNRPNSPPNFHSRLAWT